MSDRTNGYARGRARREQIVEAATELFARSGYRNATILEIAQNAGISRTGLLHHFASKEALLEAVLMKRDADDEAGFGPTPDPLGGLQRLVRLAQHNADVRHIVGLFAVLSAEAGDPQHPAHDYFVRRYEHAFASFRTSLAQALDAGILVPDVDLDHEARALIALMDGLQIQWLLAPDAVDMAAELQAEMQKLVLVPLAVV
jgi:AcrR family transcriptional regulator